MSSTLITTDQIYMATNGGLDIYKILYPHIDFDYIVRNSFAFNTSPDNSATAKLIKDPISKKWKMIDFGRSQRAYSSIEKYALEKDVEYGVAMIELAEIFNVKGATEKKEESPVFNLIKEALDSIGLGRKTKPQSDTTSNEPKKYADAYMLLEIEDGKLNFSAKGIEEELIDLVSLAMSENKRLGRVFREGTLSHALKELGDLFS